jgi:hypothetical protein
VVWEWLNDPDKRKLWQAGSAWHEVDRPRGRTGVGAHNHCSNGGILEEVLEWRPFDSFAVRQTRTPLRMLMTGELRPDGEATELCWRMSLEGSMPRAVRAAGCRLIAGKLFKVREALTELDTLIARELEPALPE